MQGFHLVREIREVREVREFVRGPGKVREIRDILEKVREKPGNKIFIHAIFNFNKKIICTQKCVQLNCI